MSIELAQRLREASVVVSDAQLAAYGEAVAKLAAVNVPGASDQLCRLRLAFSMPVDLMGTSRFDEQLAQAGVSLDRREDQLRRVLAACVLVQRFARGVGRRKRSSLTSDSLAALGARILSNTNAHPVHPDVIAWASYWTETAAVELRTSGQFADPPSLELSDPLEDDALTPQQLLAQTLNAWREQLQKYTSELAKWNIDLDPANVAAQGEQLSLLWWLASAVDEVPTGEAVVGAAESLAALTYTVPGPPGSSQVLRRRLSVYEDKTVVLRDVMDATDKEVPTAVDDICLLLAGSPVVSERLLPASVAAEWLLDELLFLRLFSELS